MEKCIKEKIEGTVVTHLESHVTTMKACLFSRKNRNKDIFWKEKKTKVLGNWQMGQYPHPGGVCRVSEGRRDSVLTSTLPKRKDNIHPFIDSLIYLMRNFLLPDSGLGAGDTRFWAQMPEFFSWSALSLGWKGSTEGNSERNIHICKPWPESPSLL